MTSTRLKHLMGADEKTLMKWVMPFVLAIALLELHVVCFLFFFPISIFKESDYSLLCHFNADSMRLLVDWGLW